MSESAAAVSCRARNRSGAIPGRPGPGPRKVIQIDPGGSLPAGPGRQRATNLWDLPDPLETGTPSGDLIGPGQRACSSHQAVGGRPRPWAAAGNFTGDCLETSSRPARAGEQVPCRRRPAGTYSRDRYVRRPNTRLRADRRPETVFENSVIDSEGHVAPVIYLIWFADDHEEQLVIAASTRNFPPHSTR